MKTKFEKIGSGQAFGAFTPSGGYHIFYPSVDFVPGEHSTFFSREGNTTTAVADGCVLVAKYEKKEGFFRRILKKWRKK